jgi:hypothetical protein
MRSEVKPQSFVLKSIRLATGWWLVLIYSERKVLLADLFREKSTAVWSGG